MYFVRNRNTDLSGKDLGWSLNLTQGNEDPEDVFGTNLHRFRKLKAKYDPKKIWSKGLVASRELFTTNQMVSVLYQSVSR